MEVTVGPPEELVPAADREHRGTLGDRLPYAGGFCEQVTCDERLFAVLAAADVEEIVLARVDRLSNRDGSHVELMPTPRRTPR